MHLILVPVGCHRLRSASLRLPANLILWIWCGRLSSEDTGGNMSAWQGVNQPLPPNKKKMKTVFDLQFRWEFRISNKSNLVLRNPRGPRKTSLSLCEFPWVPALLLSIISPSVSLCLLLLFLPSSSIIQGAPCRTQVCLIDQPLSVPTWKYPNLISTAEWFHLCFPTSFFWPLLSPPLLCLLLLEHSLQAGAAGPKAANPNFALQWTKAFVADSQLHWIADR